MAHPFADLHPVTFKGHGFAIEGLDEANEHALKVWEYSDRPGGAVEDGARRPVRVTVNAVFAGEGFLEALKNFRTLLEETGSGEFVHPLYGLSLNAAVQRFDVHVSARDGYATVAIEFIEDSLDETTFWGLAVSGPAAAAAALTQTMADLETQSQTILGTASQSTGAIATFRDYMTGALSALEETIDTDIEARLGVALAAAAAEAKTLGTRTAEVAPVLELVHLMAFQATELANIARSSKPPVREFEIRGAMSVHELAVQLYGDASRAAELEKLNQFANPLFLAAGDVVRVYAR